MFCIVLYYTYCTLLNCTVLYCTVLHCTVLYCTVLYCKLCEFSELHYTQFLMSASPMFAGMMETGLKEAKEGKTDIQSSFTVGKELVRFIYTGNIEEDGSVGRHGTQWFLLELVIEYCYANFQCYIFSSSVFVIQICFFWICLLWKRIPFAHCFKLKVFLFCQFSVISYPF